MKPIRTNLRTRFAGEIFLLLLGLGIALLALIFTARLSNSIMEEFTFLQQETATARVSSVLQSLDLRLRQTVYLNRPISHWDDTYQYAMGNAPDYPKINYNQEAINAFPFDVLLIYDNQHKLLFSVYENEERKIVPVPAGMDALIAWPEFRGLSAVDDVGYALGAFEGRVFLLCGTRISDSNGTAAPPGTYIIGCPVDKSMEADIEKLTGVTIQTDVAGAMPTGKVELLNLPELGHVAVLFEPERDGKQHAIAYLKTGDGAGTIQIIMEYPLKFSATGAKISADVRKRFYLVIGAFGLLVIFLMIEMLRRGWELQERIHEQREAERLAELARQADKAKSAFLAMMSHELRTPLNAVIGFSELMEESPLNEEQRPYMQMIHSSGTTLLALINDILDLSKIEAGKMPIEILRIKVRPFLEEIEKLFAPQAKEGNVHLSLEIQDDAPEFVYTDPLRLRQIISNLLSNAIKYTEKGFISIRVSSASVNDLPADTPEEIKLAHPKDARMLKIIVRDTGSGIPEQLYPRLFQPFSQADSSSTRKHGGSGLGLAISRKLARMMGGDLWNVRIQQGSEFVMMISMGSEDTVAHAPQITPVGQAVSSLLPEGPMKVLVVEDHAINAKLMRTMLKKYGIEAKLAIDGDEALKIATDYEPDLIFMDIQMPGRDGFEVTREIRKLERTTSRHRACIIALTADAMEGVEANCLAAGMDGYLSKPIHRSQIAEAIQRCRHLSASNGKG